jgi:mRNA-degrading endonuclease RelE of RelBE toxin-antitoxin system
VVSGLPYRIHYRIDDVAEAVEIITIAHTRQKPPRIR